MAGLNLSPVHMGAGDITYLAVPVRIGAQGLPGLREPIYLPASAEATFSGGHNSSGSHGALLGGGSGGWNFDPYDNIPAPMFDVLTQTSPQTASLDSLKPSTESLKLSVQQPCDRSNNPTILNTAKQSLEDAVTLNTATSQGPQDAAATTSTAIVKESCDNSPRLSHASHSSLLSNSAITDQCLTPDQTNKPLNSYDPDAILIDCTTSTPIVEESCDNSPRLSRASHSSQQTNGGATTYPCLTPDQTNKPLNSYDPCVILTTGSTSSLLSTISEDCFSKYLPSLSTTSEDVLDNVRPFFALKKAKMSDFVLSHLQFVDTFEH